MKNILITGGAGFIGSNLVKRLLEKRYQVIVLDNLSPQIHGVQAEYTPAFNTEFIFGDVRRESDWELALSKADIVVHLAAETGTGQSMYEVCRYADTNISGTAILLDYLVNKKHHIEKVVVASSRAVYGEGKYKCEEHGILYPEAREEKELSAGIFDPLCPICKNELLMMPTDEESKIHPSSVYGITKLNQEQLVLNVCKALNISAVAFRYQNVYGPGQSLKNPYTGILSIFSTLILNGKSLNIFEDGNESRDFVYIDDVVDATIMGMEHNGTGQQVYNVGSGKATTVMEVATSLKELYQSTVSINISRNYRLGDIRHNLADLKRISTELEYEPKVNFKAGISLFANWVMSQEVPEDKFDQSISEMKTKGFFK